MERTKVKIIDPATKRFGRVGTVQTTDADGRSLIISFEGDGAAKYHESQVEVMILADWDMWVKVAGEIHVDTWNKLRKDIAKVEGAFVGGGFTGPEGVMNIRFPIGQALASLPAVQEIVGVYGLVATRSEPSLF